MCFNELARFKLNRIDSPTMKVLNSFFFFLTIVVLLEYCHSTQYTAAQRINVMIQRDKQAPSSFRSCRLLWSRSYVKLLDLTDKRGDLADLSEKLLLSLSEAILMSDYIAPGDNESEAKAIVALTKLQSQGRVEVVSIMLFTFHQGAGWSISGEVSGQPYSRRVPFPCNHVPPARPKYGGPVQKGSKPRNRPPITTLWGRRHFWGTTWMATS